MPSMSDGLKPASLRVLRAASACSWICDMPGMTPRSVVSAAPTTATDLGFMGCLVSLGGSRPEEGQGDLVGLLLEGDLEGHVENQGVGRLRTADDVGHHARALIQLDDSNGVGRCEARRRAMVDDVAEQLGLAARLDHRDLARGAFRAEWPRRKVGVAAVVAALQPQLASLCALPEMLGLRRRCRHGSCSLGHGILQYL